MSGEFDAQVRIPGQGQLRNVKNDAAQCKYVSASMSRWLVEHSVVLLIREACLSTQMGLSRFCVGFEHGIESPVPTIVHSENRGCVSNPMSAQDERLWDTA